MPYQEVAIKSSTFRAISTQYPPIDLFENLCNPEDYHQACEWEMVTNPRLRDTIMPFDECVFGEGASYVMAPFYYRTPPARFSTEFFGCYYASNDELTSIYEKTYHLGRFIAATEDEAFSQGLTLQLLKGAINTTLHDLTPVSLDDPIYDANSYGTAQSTITALKYEGSNGVYYNSIRRKSGFCFAVLKPKHITIPITTKKIPLHFDGLKIDKYYDHESWILLD